jgi:hypothetical protein
LAPKKTISVPKLGLNAALLGSRLTRFVSSSISHKIDNRFLWTDSSTAWNWIGATASYYQVYVSNRVGEIQMLTEPEEWRFVPGKLNPADEATRSVIEEEGLSQRWLKGPEFLFQPESEWPKDLPWIPVPDEMRACRTPTLHHFLMFQWIISDHWGLVLGEIECSSAMASSLPVIRGVFLALAESLSTDEFLLVFHHFTGIYTKPSTVHSDNGTNFVGAENELNSFDEDLPKSRAFQQFRKVKNIDWRF